MSDLEFKTDIEPINNSLKTIKQLNGVRYRWNNEAKVLGITSVDPQIGLIAQDVEKVLPEAVEPHRGYLTVKYDKVIPLLIEAVKELSDKIENFLLCICIIKNK